jgi:tetratricopeptide (TPR) repeat protein
MARGLRRKNKMCIADLGRLVMNTSIRTAYEKAAEKTKDQHRETAGDEFLNLEEYLGIKHDAAKRHLKQALMEITELIRDKQWEDVVSLFHPLDEKFPDLVSGHLDVPLREKIGFVLGQLKKYDEAIKELAIGIQKDPDNFILHSSLAYNAYNSLYAAKNREIFLGGKIKEDRVRLAHQHFQKAQRLRPDGVTNFYREGMLYKQLENKPEKALPLFQKAVANWDRLEESEKEARHQERKNFIKGLYHLSGTLLDKGAGKEALETIKRCLAQDEKTNYLSLLYKYFALGKVCFHLGRFTEAKDALLFALQCESHGPVDFVCELLARTYLAMGNTRRAMEVIRKVPEKQRRPYYRWTEADVWCAEGNLEKAKQVLIACQEKDTRSRHKALIRLAKIEYLLRDYELCLKYAEDAGRFFTEKWGNIYDESLFWQSAGALRSGQIDRAQKFAQELRDINPRFPKLDVLLEKLRR